MGRFSSLRCACSEKLFSHPTPQPIGCLTAALVFLGGLAPQTPLNGSMSIPPRPQPRPQILQLILRPITYPQLPATSPAMPNQNRQTQTIRQIPRESRKIRILNRLPPLRPPLPSQRLRLPNIQPAPNNLLRQKNRRRRSKTSPRMTRRQRPPLNHLPNSPRKRQKPRHIRNMTATLPQRLGKNRRAVIKLIHQTLISRRLLQRRQRRAMQILHKRNLQNLPIVQIPNNRRNRLKPRHMRRAQTPLASNQLMRAAPISRAHQNGLHNPATLQRRRKLPNLLLLEGLARLRKIGAQPRKRNPLKRRPRAARAPRRKRERSRALRALLHSVRRLANQRGKTPPQSLLARHYDARPRPPRPPRRRPISSASAL